MKTIKGPLLITLWRLSLLYSIPLLTWVYLRLTGTSFAQLDDGINHHKIAVILLYLMFLLIWVIANLRIKKQVSQLQPMDKLMVAE